MKKVFFLPLAALLFAACSDSTAPVAKDADLTPRSVDMAPSCPSGAECLTFDDTQIATTGAAFSVTSGGTATITAIPNDPGDSFLGRFTNQVVNLEVAAATGNTVTLRFDLYIIGTWDGNGGHKYGPDTWQVSAYCGTSLLGERTYSFSNKRTTLQSYPDIVSSGLDHKGRFGSLEGVSLGFSTESSTQRITNKSVSDYDAVYRFTGVSFGACASGATTFEFKSPSNGLQPAFDESWGLDNVVAVRN